MISFRFLLVLVLVTVSFSQLYEDDGASHNCLSEEGPVLKKICVRPCTNKTRNVKKLNTDVLIIDNTFIDCSNSRDRNAVFRMKTHSSNATKSNPVVFVTRDDSNVQSWKLPLQLQTYSTSFNTSYRTICSTVFRDNNTNEQEVAMYIDVFTSSSEELEYNIEIKPVDNFVLKLHNETVNGTVHFYAAANAPQMYYFKFPEESSTVQVVATSPNKSGCAIVSVQNATCPVNDLLQNARSKGVYQTMITDASLTVTAHETIEGDDFFIIVIVAEGSLCHKLTQADITLPNPSGDLYHPYYVTLTVKPWKPASRYPGAIIAPVILFFVLGVVVCVIFKYPCCHCTFRYTRDCCTVKWTLKKNNEEDDKDITQPINIHSRDDYSNLDDELNVRVIESSGKVRKLLDQTESSIRIPELLKTPVVELQKQYSVYGWNTITVGIFYGLPVFQLVLAEQLILNSSGNQDACYYNFKCSHPLGVLSSFNSIWSNIGYTILGVTFIVIVAIRHIKSRKEQVCNPEGFKNYGIPQFFGIYYAMGVALIMEGFMSASYHICPSNNNFQFDTAFMFIIGGLLIVKIFQSRHSDVHSNAFVAFFCFAVVIFFTLIGIHEDSIAYWPTRATLCVLVVISIFIFCLSFYFYHDWRMEHWIKWDTYKRIWEWFKSWCVPCNSKENCKSFIPRHKARFIKMTITLIGNILIGIVMIISHKGVATIILSLFIANFLLFTSMYLLSKFYYREPWTAMPIVFLVILGACWAAAFYFYFNNVAQWEATPAESREYNKECRMLDFYDNHDIWHFFSAIALFFSFLFVLTLDDGLKEIRRDAIKVF